MPAISGKKYVDSSWDFRAANTKENTHCYHNYPAMMIPQIAARLISKYGKNANTLFDPYCGTGTSLVEANLRSINAYGTDLNPLARLIAETKTTRIKLPALNSHIEEFNNASFPLNSHLCKAGRAYPNFSNIDFWFKEETKDKLAAVKFFIDSIDDKKVQKFFLVAFSETVRESSLTRNGEFKLYRIPQHKMEKFDPDVFTIMTSKLSRNFNGLKSYLGRMKSAKAKANVYGFDTSESIGKIKKQSIDIVVTSPPYGDSKTTVAYGQFSRLANQWLGVENASKIDNILMGGSTQEMGETGFDLIDQTVNKIALLDVKRAKEVYSFYENYIRSIANVSDVIKHGGYACYVVGNRRVKNITLPTDEITKHIFEKFGFRYKNTFVRSIPNKRMPSKNSPTNKTGHKSVTMCNEYIVIMRKH